MPTTPKPVVSREKRLQHLGETLKALTPEQLENVIRVTANLLATRARKAKKAPPID